MYVCIYVCIYVYINSSIFTLLLSWSLTLNNLLRLKKRDQKTQHSCCPILLYDLDSINLNFEQVRKIFVAYNTAVRRYFTPKRYTWVQKILF